jgi:hypothetical protein
MKRIIIPPHYRGLGQQSGNQEAAEGLTAAAAAAAPFGPVGAAVAGTLELAAQIVNLFKPCGQTCVDATQIADQVETVLDQNNQLYFTNPNRTTGDQANALSVVNTAFSQLQSACGNPALGTAGQKCLAERIGDGMDPGSSTCSTGLTTANEYPPYGTVPYPVGVCWTWVLAYYDPIANDVPPGGSGAATESSSASSTLFGFPLPDVLAAGAALILAVLLI